MALQDVDDVYELEWGAGVKYRDVRHRDEVEQSKYAFGQVNLPQGKFAEFHRDLFDKHHEFARALIDTGLVLPALDHCLKCSHVFNLLDSSGSIGVTERTAYILRVRQLAVAIAKTWAGSDTAAEVPAEGATHGS
jgi:glycyl-tRNA synthetase alpha chain